MLEVIARVRDLPRLESQPPYHLEDALEIALFFGLRVRVIVAKVALPAVVRRVPEIHEDGFRMADVEEAVWLRRESRPYLPARRR